ncbi:MAG: class I SAM-dependent methyltransferase [Thermoanaerobaculia bacterium]|nr:class I SAM-dependent methyltransferase [Thermoanaerobaculia bacterium]
MGLYQRYLLPRLIDLSCGTKPVRKQREKVVPRARGRVLEIGIGSGRNLPFYDREKVTRLWGLEPAPEMRRLAEPVAARVGLEVVWLDLPGEEIPLDDGSVDTVVMTYTLCSIPDTRAALRQMARVLAPGGRLLFCEHGASPEPAVRRWQDRVNPLWKRLAGGCHLNREIPALLEEGGFVIEDLETMYTPGWRPASFNYWGSAAPG